MPQKLGPLIAILRRCGVHLSMLHLSYGLIVQMRFGRFFALLPNLCHLRIEAPLDEWHLEQIRLHFGHQLKSLSLRISVGEDK